MPCEHLPEARIDPPGRTPHKCNLCKGTGDLLERLDWLIRRASCALRFAGFTDSKTNANLKALGEDLLTAMRNLDLQLGDCPCNACGGSGETTEKPQDFMKERRE